MAAQVHTIGGLSAHADQKDLLDWLDNFKGAPQLYLVHGEEVALNTLREEVRKRYTWPVEIATPGQRVEF